MGLSEKRHQAERWLHTAREDLKAAEVLLTAGIFAQSCFCAQQAGEKAVKALWRLVDADPCGYSVKKLLLDFPRKAQIKDLEALTERAALLDKFYIPTRYPNGLPDLTPGQIYGKEDAQRGIEAARTLVEACWQWFSDH